MNRADAIAAIKAHADRFGLKATTIGQMAVRNRHLLRNLEQGKDVQIGTLERLAEWMREDAAKRQERAA